VTFPMFCSTRCERVRPEFVSKQCCSVEFACPVNAMEFSSARACGARACDRGGCTLRCVRDHSALPGREAVMKIVEYDDSLAAEFRDINLEWISSMFRVEAVDLEVLEHPRERIIDAGGAILFVATDELGIVGACALMPAHPTGAFELT